MDRLINQRTFRWLALLGACALLVYHALRFGFITDDAYISFVYARSLAEHGELVFNQGMAPVEGITNFLWTFNLALCYKLGFSLEKSAAVLGVTYALGSFILMFRLSRSLFKGPTLWDALAPLVLASTSGFACWSSGGLETQMFVFWCMAALATYCVSDYRPRLLRLTGLSLALAAMTRPEGLLIAGLMGLHRIAVNIVRDRRLVPHRYEWACVIWFASVFGPFFIWRYVYYGYPFPNTFYAKATGEASTSYLEELRQHGWIYLRTWARQSFGWGVAALSFFCLIAKLKSARFLWSTLSLFIVSIYFVYTLRVGGDFMGLHRFIMLPWVLLVVSACFGVRSIYRACRHRWTRLLTLLLTLAAFTYYAFAQADLTRHSVPKWRNSECQSDPKCIEQQRKEVWPSNHGIDSPSYLAVYAHDRKIIGETMAPCFKEQDFAIFGGVGAKPYFAGLRGVDVFGLVSGKVAHEVDRTRPRPGHNKWGPDALMLKWYQPEFVFQCYSIHEKPDSPALNCQGNFWERAGYRRVTMQVPGLIEKGEFYTFYVREDRAESFVKTCPRTR